MECLDEELVRVVENSDASSSCSDSSLSSDEGENIDLLVTAFENGTFKVDPHYTLEDEEESESESESESASADKGPSDKENDESVPVESRAGSENPYPVSSGEQHRAASGRAQGGASDSEKGRKKKSKKKHDKQRKRGEKREKKLERMQSKRAQRLEKNQNSLFNLRNIANKLIYFVEEVDDDTFQFPAIPNQMKQSGSCRLAMRFVSKLSKVFEMKVVTLHKVKKFVLVGAMRSARTPCFVSDKHREQVKEILKEWNFIKNPQLSDQGEGQSKAESGAGHGKKKTKGHRSSNKKEEAKTSPNATKPKLVHFVQSESIVEYRQDSVETIEALSKTNAIARTKGDHKKLALELVEESHQDNSKQKNQNQNQDEDEDEEMLEVVDTRSEFNIAELGNDVPVSVPVPVSSTSGLGYSSPNIVTESRKSSGNRGVNRGKAASHSHSHSHSHSPAFGYFEKYTKGFGSKMLNKMGFKEGQGLGKDKQGTSEPLSVQKRKKNLGLGAEFA